MSYLDDIPSSCIDHDSIIESWLDRNSDSEYKMNFMIRIFEDHFKVCESCKNEYLKTMEQAGLKVVNHVEELANENKV